MAIGLGEGDVSTGRVIQQGRNPMTMQKICEAVHFVGYG